MKKEYYVYKMNLTKLNIFAIVLFILVSGITLIISPKLFKESWFILGEFKEFLIFYPCMMGYMVLHELLHAAGYILHGASPKKITFGMEMEKSVFYCLCKQDITRKNILNAVMFPLFWIGIVTYIISIIFNLPMLLFLSIINISGAAGDIMYFNFISKLNKNVKFTEMDDGTSFAILSDKDISKTKSFGLEFIEKTETIPRNDFKRIKISKFSYVFVLLTIICLVLGLVIQ